MEYIDSDGQVLTITINYDGTKQYCNSKNQLHRLDGPAIEFIDGSYLWWINNRRHRIGMPAYFNGEDYFEWWENDIELRYKFIVPFKSTNTPTFK